MPEVAPEDQNAGLLLAGWLKGLSEADRHVFSDHERANLARSGRLLLKFLGHPDLDPEPSITCPRCGRTSYHPEDVRHGYCGACHQFFEGGGT